MRRLLLLAGLAWIMPVRAQPTLPPALAEQAAVLLGQLIETARERAIADGVRPIPPNVYRGLLGYFPAALLSRARFATGGGTGITLPALALTYGDATAMTLGDVILFRTEQAANNDLTLWAHELTHVLQYQRWGIAGFAGHYVADRAGVEREAVDTANKFNQWHAQPTSRATR